MSNVTKEQIDFLVELQQIEIEKSEIISKLSSVDQRVHALDVGLNDFAKTIEVEESHIKELNQKYRSFESDAKVNLNRIDKSREKLRSVKTNKEYQSSLKEIEDLENINSKMEDQMIECLDLIDSVENGLRDKKEQYSRLSEQANKERAFIQEEVELGEKTIAKLEEKHNHISRKINSDLMKKFNRVKETQANNIAIVAVKDAVCQGCNMNIPPQMYNELHRLDSLKNCPHCQRIIYWHDNNTRLE
jgi:predicted  nucleic acid-binding Zn-ribbon protein